MQATALTKTQSCKYFKLKYLVLRNKGRLSTELLSERVYFGMETGKIELRKFIFFHVHDRKTLKP